MQKEIVIAELTGCPQWTTMVEIQY